MFFVNAVYFYIFYDDGDTFSYQWSEYFMF